MIAWEFQLTFITQTYGISWICGWVGLAGNKKAHHIIAISHNTKRDLIKCANIPEERISVIYHGIDPSVFYPRYGERPFPFPYILFVGSEHPRKDLETLRKASISLNKKDTSFKAIKLVKEHGFRGGGFIYRFCIGGRLGTYLLKCRMLFLILLLRFWLATYRGYGLWVSCNNF